jgi:transposase
MEITKEVREVVLSATKELKGSALRRFMADIVRKLGPGGQRQAANEFRWGRDTIRKGEHELRSGIECVDGRCGNRAGVDERLPNLKADIRDIVECWSQTDPRFRTTIRYSRLSVPQVAQRLVRDKGYDDRELPSNETIRGLMHELGFKPRKVRKARPKKNSRKPTRSSTSFMK